MTDRANDPQRLLTAAHELGHAITWRVLGFEVADIWIKGHGDSARGEVWLKHTDDSLSTLAKERSYQVGLFAGWEAQLRWCDETGIPFDEDVCAGDMANHRERRRTPLGRQVRPSDARATARRLVRVKWARIVRLTPLLAARGSLSPSRV